MPPTPVEVSEVRPLTVRDQFRALGSIQSDEIVQVVSEINAIATRVPFAEGQPVAAGALIAQLDDREARADAQRSEAQRELAQLNAERSQRLFEQNAISSQERDNATTSLKVAEANEALAKARLAKTHITAPFAGMVGRRRVSPGAYLKSGDVITDLARVDDMKVAFAAPERFLGELKPGREVQVTTPAFPDDVFRGRLTVVDPIVDPNTRTVQLVARISNTGLKLRPGMSANVSVTFAERTGALVVPDEAVFAEGNQSFVYRVKQDSTVARTAVTLGTRDSSQVEVLSGLEAGALIVRAGHQKLFDGARVHPVREGEGAAGGAPAAAAPAKAEAPGAPVASSSGGAGQRTATAAKGGK